MKTITALEIRKEGLTDAQNEGLERICPKQDHLRNLVISAWDHETEALRLIDEIVAYCQGCGMERSESGNRLGTYGFSVRRVYEDEDLLKAEYLLLRHAKGIDCEACRDGNNEVLLFTNKMPKQWNMLWHYHGSMLVTDAEKERVEAERFSGIKFLRATAKKAMGKPAVAEFWELTSRVVLPPIANIKQLVYSGQEPPEPFDGDYTRRVHLNDPPFSYGEFHYRRKDFEALGPFDIDHTLERYYSNNPVMVVSNRFMRFYERKKHRLVLEPVRIDEE